MPRIELTPEQLEAHERALRELPLPPEDYQPGGDETKREELEHSLSQADEIAEDMKTSALEREIESLREQLQEQQQLVQRMFRERGSELVDAADVALHLEQEQWRKIFNRIKRNGGKCTVMLHASDDPDRNWPVPVGVNGHLRYLPRNKPVIVSLPELEVLVNSRILSQQPRVQESGERVWENVYLQSYPFTLLDERGQVN